MGILTDLCQDRVKTPDLTQSSKSWLDIVRDQRRVQINVSRLCQPKIHPFSHVYVCVCEYVVYPTDEFSRRNFRIRATRDSAQDYSRSHPEADPGWDRIRQVTHEKKRKKVPRDPRIEWSRGSEIGKLESLSVLMRVCVRFSFVDEKKPPKKRYTYIRLFCGTKVLIRSLCKRATLRTLNSLTNPRGLKQLFPSLY